MGELALLTAASPKLFRFDKKKCNSDKEEGKRGLCVSTDEKSLEMDLSILPSGRFIYGRQYVKPMEFQFWSTAPSKQPPNQHPENR